MCAEHEKLEHELAEAREELAEAIRQRKESDDLRSAMVKAAADSSRSVLSAYERIQQLQEVVDAAEKWRNSRGMAASEADVELWRAVDKWRITRSRWS